MTYLVNSLVTRQIRREWCIKAVVSVFFLLRNYEMPFYNPFELIIFINTCDIILQNTSEYILFAAVSKFMAALATYPYQVIRARLQDHHLHYKGTLDCLASTWRYEGCRGFYKGLTPYLLHVLPNICLVLVIYEKFTNNSWIIEMLYIFFFFHVLICNIKLKFVVREKCSLYSSISITQIPKVKNFSVLFFFVPRMYKYAMKFANFFISKILFLRWADKFWYYNVVFHSGSWKR